MVKNNHIQSYKTSKGRRYKIVFTLMNVRFRKSNLISREEAERLYASVRSQILNGTWNDQKNTLESNRHIKIENVFRIYFKKIKTTGRYKKSSIYDRRIKLNLLKKILGSNTKLSTLTDYKVKKKINTYHIQRECSQAYINHIIGVWNQFVKWANDYGYAEHLTPLKWEKVHSKKTEEVFLTRQELERFFSTFRRDKKHEMFWYRYYKVLFNLALRQGELHALRWEDINFPERRITISRTMVRRLGYGLATQRTKNGIITTLPLTDETYKILLDQRDYVRNTKIKGDNRLLESGLVFPSRMSAKMMDHSSPQNVLPRYRKRSGIKKKITSHTFRRSFCLLAIESGINLRILAHYTRHNPQTLLIHYTAVRDDYFYQRFTNFSPLESKKKGTESDNILPKLDDTFLIELEKE